MTHLKLCLLVIPLLLGACTPAQLDDVRSASDKKDALCRFAEVWAPDTPELRRVRELCQADAEFQAVLRAYAGCSTAEE